MDSFTAIVFTISSFSDLSEFLPFFSWVFFAKKGLPWSVLGKFFLFSALLKLVTLITAEFQVNNMPLFHLLAMVEISILYVFYCILLGGRISYAILALLVISNLANALFIQDIFMFNSIAWTVNMMILLAIGFYYLANVYHKDDDNTPLEGRPDFIITAGWLIYAAGSLFTYLMGTEILSGKAEGFFHNAWLFQCISNIVKNVFVSYGLWLTK